MLLFVPAADRKLAVCVREADSIATVQRFIDLETGGGARPGSR